MLDTLFYPRLEHGAIALSTSRTGPLRQFNSIPVSRSPEATCPTLTRTEQPSTRPPLHQYQLPSSLVPRQSIPRPIRGPPPPFRTRTRSSTRPIRHGTFPVPVLAHLRITIASAIGHRHRKVEVGVGRALAALAGLTLMSDWARLLPADLRRGVQGRQLGRLNTWTIGMSSTS
jgi:hypothetical protein